MSSLRYPTTMLKPTSQDNTPLLQKTQSSPELSNPIQQEHNTSRYTEGNILRLRFSTQPQDTKSSPARSKLIRAKILRTFEPSTMSCAMLVAIYEPTLDLEGKFVVKMYDREFAAKVRREHLREEMEKGVDVRYWEWVALKGGEGELRGLMGRKGGAWWGDGDGDGDEEEDGEDEGLEMEMRIHAFLLGCFEAECGVYERLGGLQGGEVPRFIGCVDLPGLKRVESLVYDVPGVLLQYVPGFSLGDMFEKEEEVTAPRESWQGICDEAIRVVNNVMERGVFNRDVSVWNTIVRWDSIVERWRVVVFDFGHCEVRGKEVGDREWRRMQAHMDEEGAIGVVMQGMLRKRRGGGFVYKKTEYAEGLSFEFMGEDGEDM